MKKAPGRGTMLMASPGEGSTLGRSDHHERSDGTDGSDDFLDEDWEMLEARNCESRGK